MVSGAPLAANAHLQPQPLVQDLPGGRLVSGEQHNLAAGHGVAGEEGVVRACVWGCGV
jgi:hypothetical protein